MYPWKIPKEFINQLLYQTNIIDLIKSRLTLKKIGKNYQSLCPFHNEKTPSFTVNHNKQFYYCFGCNAHGNAIDFLMNYEKLNFLESVEELSIFNGLIIPKKINNKLTNNDICNKYIYHTTLQKICNIYVKKMLKPINNIAYQYLIHRGIKPNIIHHFSIGFSGEKINYISQYYKFNINTLNILIKLGIIVQDHKNKQYDHFRKRIIFPIRDKHGRINGFGGRSIYSNIKPKYLNSPDSITFKKNRQIYGIFELLQYNPLPNKIIVVEGYIDVIMMTQHHIHDVVAVLGSSITTEQIQYLFRITNTIIYCYDGDLAGRNASWKSLILSLPYLKNQKKIKFIFLPTGTDPDSIIKTEGTNKFVHRINNAITLSDFLFSKLLKKFNLTSIEDKSYFTSYTLSLINQIPNTITKIYLRKQLGYELGILDIEQINNILYKHHKKHKNTIVIKQTPMRILIGLLIQNPKLSLLIPHKHNLINLNIPGSNLFLNLINICINNPNYHTGQILELYRGNIIENILRKLIIWDHMIVEKKIKEVFIDTLNNIRYQILENKYQKFIIKEKLQGLNSTEKKKLWLITKYLSLKSKKKIKQNI